MRERNYKGMTLESVVELENGKMVMVSEFFNEDVLTSTIHLTKMAISWVKAGRSYLLADEEHRSRIQNVVIVALSSRLACVVLFSA